MPGSGGVPLALLDLTGLTFLSFYDCSLVGSIPAALAQQLAQLTHLDLEVNDFTGTVPNELTRLTALTSIGLSQNPHLGGILPAFNFAQFMSCSMSGVGFSCPLPPSAQTCSATCN